VKSAGWEGVAAAIRASTSARVISADVISADVRSICRIMSCADAVASPNPRAPHASMSGARLGSDRCRRLRVRNAATKIVREVWRQLVTKLPMGFMPRMGDLFCVLAMAAVSIQSSASELNDYPTAARADYVFACMKTNGETRQALDQCSCAIDVIASIL